MFLDGILLNNEIQLWAKGRAVRLRQTSVWNVRDAEMV